MAKVKLHQEQMEVRKIDKENQFSTDFNSIQQSKLAYSPLSNGNKEKRGKIWVLPLKNWSANWRPL